MVNVACKCFLQSHLTTMAAKCGVEGQHFEDSKKPKREPQEERQIQTDESDDVLQELQNETPNITNETFSITIK